MTPGWILDVLAALMLVVAAVSAARLIVASPAGDRLVLAGPGRAARPGASSQRHADSDVAHFLMAIAMAGALAPALATVPDDAWAVIFMALTAWFAWPVAKAVRADGIRGLGGGQCAPSLVHAAAMLYMSLTVAGRTGTGPAMAGGMGASGDATPLAYPTVAFALALILVGYAIWDLDQLSARRAARLSPAMTVACRVVMGVTMAFMLVIML